MDAIVSRSRRLARVTLAALAVAGLAACESRVRWSTGTQLVVATHEGVPGGVRTSRERWRLVEADSATGTFAVRRDGGRDHEVRRSRVAAGFARGGGGRTRRTFADAPEVVRVPAGRFRCERSVHTRVTPQGPVMRVDEWWSPGVPVAVQRWERWEGQAADTLFAPPRRAVDVPVGARWSVLESVGGR